ncbi:MAG: beta-galactosidase [candidate division KSB1 bacterium]|nr:beta-galactosidase [candidate division KSB1 bacterium]
MKKVIWFIALLLLFYADGIFAQSISFNWAGDSLLPVGVYYYPEHWPRQQWSRDIQRIRELGFSFIHIGEFAWAQLEPEEGRFDFTWLDSCILEAEKHGLKVILCTPTPTPPAWLTVRYPEMLLVDENGIQQQHGSRLHINPTHPIFLKYAERIVKALARRYGNNRTVIGWQIDNEPHLGTLYDYSETAQRGFRQWLKEKYQNEISRLNSAWGTAFWSQSYNNFDQIQIPNARRAPQGVNPHALLDFRRYTADALASFIRFQSVILRQYISSWQWITTNYAYYKFLPSVDLFRNQGDLDFASHTMYLLSTYLDDAGGELGFRLGSGLELAFSSEFARSIAGFTGIMELQPGQINWGKYNAQPLPGAVRMWLWHSFALGDRFICTYRYRQPLFGSEQTHKGIMELDGMTLSRGGNEFVQTIAEIHDIARFARREAPWPVDLKSRKTAFLWKQDNLWEQEASKHNQEWDSWRHVYHYYAALKSMGAPVTFIQEQDDYNVQEFPFLVAPAYSMVNASVIYKWQRYVKDGGHLILSCRSGQKDNHGHFHATLLGEPLWELIGARILDNDQLPSDRHGTVDFNGQHFKWRTWGEWLVPDAETEVLAQYADQFYAGTPAAVRRDYGAGSVTYIGVHSTDGKLEQAMLQSIFEQAGAKVLKLPDYVFVEWHDGLWVGVNYSSQAAVLPIPESANLITGEKIIPPGGVTIWSVD